MNFNYEFILFYATVVCGIIALFDVIFLAPRRKLAHTSAKKMPILSDYARSFFPILLIVFLLRSFLYEPFRIPSGSLEPTLLIGDFILVNKFDYGIRLPVLHTKIYPMGEIKHGDIVVFRYPVKPSIDYIKRIVGLPGDRITYINKILYVNGKKIPQTFLQQSIAHEGETRWEVVEKQEDFFGVKHSIQQIPDRPSDNFKNVLVPPGMYFAMGDNRDDSLDSRYWGFVPDKNIIGKASAVWMSWNTEADWLHKIRWQRIGEIIH